MNLQTVKAVATPKCGACGPYWEVTIKGLPGTYVGRDLDDAVRAAYSMNLKWLTLNRRSKESS